MWQPLTALYGQDVFLVRGHVEHLADPLVIREVEQVLVEPRLALSEWLRADNVHEAWHELGTFQQEVEVVEDDAWVSGKAQQGLR